MGKKKRRVACQEAEVPISAMIDIVFLLIIFFVVTATINRDALDEEVRLAHAPHGPALIDQDPRSVVINVRRNGVVNINGAVVGKTMISAVLSNSVAIWGRDIPVIIRGDANAPHGYVQEVMAAVNAIGLSRIRFNAVVNEL